MQARNDGWVVKHNEDLGFMRGEGLRVVLKRCQKRTGLSELPTITDVGAPGGVWAIGFVFH